MDLLEIRGRLDQIDTQIEKLFEERMRLCSEVAEYKIATGKAVYDAERETEDRVSSGDGGGRVQQAGGLPSCFADDDAEPPVSVSDDRRGASAVRIWASIRWRSLKPPENAWCSRD